MLRLTTLGALDLRDRLGRQVREVLSQPKRIALLVHLALESRRGPVPRDRLVAMFWPESDDTRARNALSQALYHLRQVLGPDVIVGQGTTLGLAPDRLWCDAVLLEDALDAGDTDLALDLYRGEFCPALFVSGAPAAEEWLDERRRAHRRRLLDAARGSLRAAEARGDLTSAARLARQAMALGPDDEIAVREHLAAIARGGDLAGALAAFTAHARRLAAEFETEPAPETIALVEGMRARRAESVARHAPASTARADITADTTTDTKADSMPSGTPERITPERTAPRSVGRGALLAAALVLVISWAMLATSRLGVAGAAAAAPRRADAIAIFPFAVRGGPTGGTLGGGMADLLAAKLDGLDAVRAIDPRSSVLAAEGRTPAPQAGAQLARALGARYFVVGDLVEHAGRVQLDGVLYDAARPTQAVARASVTGDTVAMFALVDDMAGQLLAGVLTGRDSVLTRLAAVTTPSLPALKAYLRGEAAMRDGLDAQAAAAFREAVEQDSSFALALYRLAVVANWVYVPGAEDPLVLAARAARHADRLTPLGRDLLEAFQTYKRPDSRAEEAYRAIVRAYPDNVEAWYMLGESQFHYGPFLGHPATEARAAFERTLALQPGNVHARVHLARIAVAERRPDEVERLLEEALAHGASADRLTELRLLAALARRDTSAIEAALAAAGEADEAMLFAIMQEAWSNAEDLRTAERAAQLLVTKARSPHMRDAGRILLGVGALGRGRFDRPLPTPAEDGSEARWALEIEAAAASEPLLDVPPARIRALHAAISARHPYRAAAIAARPVSSGASAAMRLHLLALLELRLGEPAAARAHLDSLERLASVDPHSMAADLVTSTRAEALRREGRAADAIAEYRRFPIRISAERYGGSGARERFALAELLRASGREAEALRLYASFPAYYETPFLAPARLREAEILERQGRRTEAADRYARVLELWDDAGAHLAPLVQRARAGLARTR